MLVSEVADWTADRACRQCRSILREWPAQNRPLPGDELTLNRLVTNARSWAHAGRVRLERVFVIRLATRTVHELGADDATHMAAGVAFYALFSLFPLLLGLSALMSFLIEDESVRSQFTEFAIEYLPGSEELVTHNIETVFGLRGAIGVFAVLGLLWSGSAVFGAIARAVNRAWDVGKDRPFYIAKPRQLAMALAVSLLFLLSLGAAAAVSLTERVSELEVPGLGFLYDTAGRFLLQGVSLVLTLFIFLLIYKLMPNTKTYWRYIWPGAVVGAVLFEAAKNLFIV